MDLFTLIATISLSTAGFTRGIQDASETMRSFGDHIDAIASAAGKAVTAGMALASGAAIAFGKDAVDVGKQFDAAMANVAAISGATGEAFNDLRETAIAMGGSTKFSATEAADALGYMAMAGWEPQQMMDGLKGVMDLAAASGENLARVSDIVTDALTAFSLKAEDSAHFADVLAVASSAANTNVSMMGETFKYVAPLAGTLGYSIEDMAVSIGLMANAGIKASQAGTSLRAGLSKLVKPTDSAMAKLKELGLTVQNLSDEEIATRTATLEQSVTAREKAYSDEENALKESLDRQYDALKKSLDARYNAQREQFDTEYDARKKALDKSYDAAKDVYDREYDARKKALDAEYDALEQTLDDEVDAVQKANEKTLSDTQKAQEATVKAYEEATERRLALIDEEYKESLRLTDEAEYNRLKELDAQIAAIQAQSDAAAKAEEEDERRERRAELQKAISAAKTAEARREAQQKLADYNENIRRKDAEAARKAQIAALKAQKDEAKEAAKAARESAKEKRDAETKEVKAQRAEELAGIKERQKEELAALKDQQKAELSEAKAARKEKLDAARESNEQDLKELKELNDWRLSTLREANNNELNALRKSQSDQLSAIKDGNEDKLKEAKNGYSKQLQALKDANKEQLAEYKNSVKAQTEALKAEGKARAAVLTDESGNTRDFIEVVEALREKFKGLSEAEQSEYAAAIFGQEAMSGWLAIINASEDDFNDLREQIEGASANTDTFAEAMKNNGFSADAMRASMQLLGVTQEEFDEALKDSKGNADDFKEALLKAADSGTTLDDIDNNLTISGQELTKVFGEMSAAAQMAGTHEDSLAGSTTTLNSALETLRIRIADKLNPTIREFTEFGQKSVVALTDAFEREDAINGLSSAIRDAEGNLLSAGQIAGVLSETLYSMSEKDRQIAIRELFGTDDIEYVNSLLDESGGKWDELLGYVSKIDAVSESTSGLSGMMDALGPIISDGIGMILEYLPQVVTVGGQIIGALVNGIIDNLPLLASGAWQVVTTLGAQLLEAAPEMAAKGGELLNFFADGIMGNVDMLASTALDLISTFAGFLADALPSVAEKLTDVLVKIAETLSDPEGLENLAQSAITIMRTLANAIIENGPRLGNAALNVVQSFGEMVSNHSDELVKIALDLISTFAGFIGDAIPRLAETAITVITSFAESLTEPESLESLTQSAGTILDGFATAILDGWPRLAESAVTIMNNFAEYLRNNFPTIIEKATEFIVNFAEKLTGPDTLSNLLNAALDIIAALVDGLLKAVPKLLEAAPEIIANLAVALLKSLPKIIEVGGEILGGLIKGIWDALPDLLLLPFRVVGKLIDKFKELLGIHSPSTVFAGLGENLVEGLLKGVSDVWHTITDFFSEKAEALIGFLLGAWETVRQNAFEAWERVQQVFSDAWSGIQSVWNSAGEWFGDRWNDVSGAFNGAAEWFSNKFTDAYNFATNAWSDVQRWASDRWNDVSGAFNNAQTWFNDTFSKAWKGAKDGFSGVKDFFGGVWNDITSVFDGAFNWFKDVGKNIVDGLAAGIGGLWNGFLNLLGVKTDEVKEEFTGPEGFDEHSPSKWAETVFRRILEGGGIGLDKGLPGILSDAENAVRDIQDALSAATFDISGGYQLPKLQQGTQISGGYSYTQTPQLSASGGYSAPMLENVIVEQPVQIVLDGRIVGQSAYRYIRTQERARGR